MVLEALAGGEASKSLGPTPNTKKTMLSECLFVWCFVLLF